MNRSGERDPAKFVDILRILNTFYSKKGEEKCFLYQQADCMSMFKDIFLWSSAFKCLLKKKKLDRENTGKPASTMLNPWRMLQGLQNIIVKKNSEEDLQSVSAADQDSIAKSESLDLFVYYLSNLNLSMDINSEILATIVKE